MQRDFPEPDWKNLSRLKPLALDRLCRRILQESGKILDRAKESGHYATYLELYKHLHTSDETVADCFNDWKRSQALNVLINWRSENLLTEEEFNTFSPDTRTLVNGFLKMR